MGVVMGEDEGGARRTRLDGRDLVSLYARLCDCAGPQPSIHNSRLDEHAADCPFRVEVERKGP